MGGKSPFVLLFGVFVQRFFALWVAVLNRKVSSDSESLSMLASLSSSPSLLSLSNNIDVTQTGARGTSSNKHNKWKWNPDADHPCTIEQLTWDEFQSRFGVEGLPPLYPTPIILLNDNSTNSSDKTVMSASYNVCKHREDLFCGRRQPTKFFGKSHRTKGFMNNVHNFATVNNHPEQSVLLTGRPQDAKRWQRMEQRNQFRRLTERNNLLELLGRNFSITLSSSNANSEHRRVVSLERYILEMLSDGGETFPDQRSNETWYLFGETHDQSWRDLLLRHYVLPPCRVCAATSSENHHIALSFGMGNRGSGVTWHTHGPGFSEAIHGRKHWVLLPPSRQSPPHFHKDQSSRQWMEYVYSNKNNSSTQTSHQPWPLYECTLHPGDMLYFPTHWWHMTINLDPYTVFVSTFTTEHMVEQFQAI